MLYSLVDRQLLISQTASSTERINLMMRRGITADIQRSQLRFTLGLMTAMAFSIRRVAPSPRCVSRHILCHQSAQHAVDPCRDTVARSQVLFRARRSTSTRFRSTRISPHASRPSRSQDRPQTHGHSHRGGSRHGMSCRKQPYRRLRALAGNHRGMRWLYQAKGQRRPSCEAHYTASV
jgi:hypothetical protein